MTFNYVTMVRKKNPAPQRVTTAPAPRKEYKLKTTAKADRGTQFAKRMRRTKDNLMAAGARPRRSGTQFLDLPLDIQGKIAGMVMNKPKPSEMRIMDESRRRGHFRPISDGVPVGGTIDLYPMARAAKALHPGISAFFGDPGPGRARSGTVQSVLRAQMTPTPTMRSYDAELTPEPGWMMAKGAPKPQFKDAPKREKAKMGRFLKTIGNKHVDARGRFRPAFERR